MNIPINDIDYFLKFIRMVSYCYMELLIDPETEEQEIDIDESMYLVDNDELEELITLSEINDIVNPYIKNNNITNKLYISYIDSNTVRSKITYKMIIRFYKNLEDCGVVELCWDSKSNDFIYRAKK